MPRSHRDGGGSSADERFRSLFVDHPLAVFGLDLDGRLTEVNPAVGRISGYPPEQLLAMALSDLVAPEDLDRVRAALSEVLDRRPRQVELSIRRADGTPADLAVTGIPVVVDDRVVGAFGIADDVTERNRTARELQAARQVAAGASQAKSEFVARMSHELRTPLTSILATAELLAETEPTPAQLELIATLQRSGTRLRSLVDRVLDFAVADESTEQVTEEFDLHAVVRGAVALVEESATAKGLQVELDLAPDVPRRVRDHPSWTAQILVNLLTNAVQHTAVGSVDLTVTVQHSATVGPGILYRITDTGVGIAAAEHERVFEPFVSLASGAGASGRTGLGLSVVKQLVTISGGTIALDSAAGRGTTFLVLLPARPADPS